MSNMVENKDRIHLTMMTALGWRKNTEVNTQINKGDGPHKVVSVSFLDSSYMTPARNIKLNSSGLSFMKWAVEQQLHRNGRFWFSVKITQLIKEILHCNCHMHVDTEHMKARSLCSSSAAPLTSAEDAGIWDLWTFNLCHADWLMHRKQPRTIPFSLQTNASVRREFDCCVIYIYIKKNPDVLWSSRQVHPIILNENSSYCAHTTTRTYALTLEVSFKW